MRAWKFLLVDDSPMSLKILADILKMAGYESILSAYDAYTALELLNQSSGDIDIVITDLLMPGLDGVAFCKLLKEDKNHQSIPVVMITSSNDVENLEQSFQAGVADYITKPFNPIEVLTRIKAVLQLKDEMEKRLERELEVEKFNKMLVDDLTIAKHLQLQMLPASVKEEKVEISGFYMPIAFLGGDLYYWCKLGRGRYGVILLDVMGHGTATSMICMYIRSNLPPLMRRCNTAAELIGELNGFMLEFNRQLSQSEYHCTAFYMIIDTYENTIDYVNAAHQPLALLEDGKKIRWMDQGCQPIGIFKSIEVLSEKISYAGETHIFMYSDGLFEVLKEHNLDIEYLLDSISKQDQNANSPDAIIKKYLSQLEALKRTDDVSLVLVKLMDMNEVKNE